METTVKPEIEERAGFIEGFDDFKDFINLINSPLQVAIIPMTKDDGRSNAIAGFVNPMTGEFIGGFEFFKEDLDSEDKVQRLLGKISTSEQFAEELEDDDGTKYAVRPPIVVAVVDVLGEPKLSIEHAKYTIALEGLVEIGDFVSDDHMVLTAGKYDLFFNDLLEVSQFVNQLIDHAKVTYDELSKTFPNKEIKPKVRTTKLNAKQGLIL